MMYMDSNYSSWEEYIIKEQKLTPNTIGTIIKLQNIKENTYLTYYYGNMSLIILKRNLISLTNKEYSNQEIFDIVNKKSNYYKIFKNKNLSTDILTDEDCEKLNKSIIKYIKAVLISKSENDKYIEEINKLSKGDYSSLTDLHNVFKTINKFSKINKQFEEEKNKLDTYFENKYKELENTNEYMRIVSQKWKNQLISGS